MPVYSDEWQEKVMEAIMALLDEAVQHQVEL